MERQEGMQVLHTHHSSFREKLLEHLFVGEVLRHLWRHGISDAEFLKPDVDNGGYDLVLASNSVIRHIQLKSSYNGAKASGQKVHVKLANKPSGCVVWLEFDEKSLALGPFWWFGGEPREPLPDINCFKVAKHTKGNAKGEKTERPHIRVIPKTKFVKLQSISELVRRLFGVNKTEVDCD